MAIYTYTDVEAHHVFHSGGGIHGTAVGDTYNLTATNSLAQFHPFSGLGNDTINMIFSDIDGFAHGHHTFADYPASSTFTDTYDFIDIHEVNSGGVVVGRLDDYDSTRDIIKIEGEVLDLYDISSFEHPNVSSIRIVEYNGAHTDPDAHAQQWLLIETSTGGIIFYAIEGARVAMDGNGGSQSQETHFLMPEELPASFSDLETVKFVAKHNYVPSGYTAEAGGVTYNDRDVTIADVDEVIGDDENEASQMGDLIAGGLNDDFVTALGGDDFVWGGSGHDQLFGGEGDDYIEGNSGSDLLDGGHGSDYLIGGIGDDELKGGDGNDFLVGGLGADTLNGDAGIDTADYTKSDSGIRVDLSSTNEQGYVLGFGGHATGDWLYGIENITGSAKHNDKIVGSDGQNILKGLNGDDQLFGRGGDDILLGEIGKDRLWGGQGNDHLSGGAGKDTLVGGDGSDALVGGSGADKLRGGMGDDTADYSGSTLGVRINLSKLSAGGWSVGKGGQAEGDKLKGVESVIGSGVSGDRIRGSNKDNKINGLGGGDKLFARGGDDRLDGGEGDDTLHGGTGSDTLYGGSGDDILIGGKGNGSDVFNGGLGDDVFIFHKSFGADVITDFDVFGLSDVIDLTRVSDFESFDDLMANHVTQVGTGTLIEDGKGNSIFLENVNAADLSADDFLFS